MRLIGAVLGARARARHRRRQARRCEQRSAVRVLAAPYDWSREPDL